MKLRGSSLCLSQRDPMKLLLLCFVVAGLCVFGCGRPRPAPPPPAAPVAQPLLPDAAPPTPAAAPERQTATAPPSDSAEPVEEAGLVALNAALNAYIMGELKEPKALEDLVKAGFIKRLPAAPAGKKFVLNSNRTQVLLVNK